MTDSGRKDLSDKISDKVTPQGSKSTTDKIGEGIQNVGDKAQRDLVPDSQKSTGQSVSDKFSREKDSAKSSTKGNESILDKAKDTLGLNK